MTDAARANRVQLHVLPAAWAQPVCPNSHNSGCEDKECGAALSPEAHVPLTLSSPADPPLPRPLFVPRLPTSVTRGSTRHAQ
ncbi:hypothetical protein E2C01_000887 [Portunus trituberculatus]|uniref:Uncharacterized protein n=1 Tax=Portunus trituberculatus TaxID=210409 RepID=A0A5B7CIU2_PORTR|nr:hypothetical protein [Portunus trituberculatus]